ncbi:MAG: FAD-binding protein, partial [Spirochaetaceae bacterium]|nr:FAD-binding protein [Spirochaetaceae bacterium]
MSGSPVEVCGKTIPVHRVHVLVAGSGAASLAAADRLHEAGVTDMAIVTEDLAGGTSLNTGSDKQTYYKLSAATKAADSPYEMARALYSGGSMHGDIALVEALCSLEAFYHLLAIGVPFPRNRYGGVVGYKTDHDPKDRGTSIGPYTSKSMVEQLLREVRRRGIRVYDKYEIVSLLVEEGRAAGALCMNTEELDNGRYGLELFMADVTVFGVGGPGGIYEASVYPPVHTGAIGLALEAGAEAVNLTESQYGLASVKFRWNVSGTYQQVIPRYISTDASGGDEKEFLAPFFQDAGKMNSAVFLKGYQWPFDPRKIENNGSSLIDILVYRERVLLGRRVFLDYRRNPGPEGSFRFEDLAEEAFTYLKNSAALFGTPLERLGKMNAPAIELYKSRGIDISREPLEIAVSAQHNNGGLAADIFWESTNIRRLFPVGEVNGTHGVYRPGGSALNSGQVGALRAAQKIAESCGNDSVSQNVFEAAAQRETRKILGLIAGILDTGAGSDTAAGDYRRSFQRRMTAAGSHIRSEEEAANALREALEQTAGFSTAKIKSPRQLPFALKNRHLALTHAAYLSAITAALAAGGGSRGSYLVMDAKGKTVHPALEDARRHKPQA